MIDSSLARIHALRPATRAILYMMVMVFCFSVLETTAKHLSRSYPVPMLVWCRYATHALLMVLLLARSRGTRLLRTPNPAGQCVRAALLMGSTLFNFNALHFLPMAEVKAVSFVSPLLVTVFAVWLLREHVTRARWLAVAAGFCGVLFIVRPGSAMLQWPALFALGSASCYSIYQIMTRKMSDSEDPLTTLFYTAAVGFVLLSFVVPFFWQAPHWKDVPLMVLLGCAGGFGHFMLIKAMELENASFLSPLGYVQLLWVMLFGYLFFGDFPDAHAFIGMAIIVVSGLYVALGHRPRPQEEPDTAIE
ncbi:MAG TPA: DMT family transporter [Burkholderiales bacterium]|nr:DMT family transporter [Burkholderiales bacterium]